MITPPAPDVISRHTGELTEIGAQARSFYLAVREARPVDPSRGYESNEAPDSR